MRATVGGVRETVEVSSIGYLILAVELAALVAVPLFLIPGPVQRWGVRSLERFERIRHVSGVRRAAPLLTQILVLPARIQDRVDGHGLAPLYVVRWWRAAPLAMPIRTLQFILLEIVLMNVDDMADWEHLRLSADPGPTPGVVQELLSSLIAVPAAVRPTAHLQGRLPGRARPAARSSPRTARGRVRAAARRGGGDGPDGGARS